MLEMKEALERVLAHALVARVESVSLHEAHGRRCAEDVTAPSDVPPWDNSAMDGYAVRAADTGEGARLKLLGVVGAGSVADRPVGPGEALAIMTGAPLPEGADAVVIVEDTDGATEGEVALSLAAEPGAHIRRQGTDIPAGSVILRKGDRITPGRVGLLASVGAATVSVFARPKVAILATGDEVIRPGTPLGPGQIYSSNPYALAGLVREAGGEPLDLGSVPDVLEATVARMEQGLAADVLLTTGGVSVGRFDLVKLAFETLGVPMDFWKVKMKPGKPLAYGRVQRDGRTVPVFGLPGNPVSCMVNFLQFVRPVLLRAQGVPTPFLPVVSATVTAPIRERPGRAKLIRVVLEQGPSGWTCRGTGSQSSGVLTSMATAHGLLLRSAELGTIEAGETVQVQLLDASFLDRADPGLPW